MKKLLILPILFVAHSLIAQSDQCQGTCDDFFNVFLGPQTGDSLSTGYLNTFIGHSTGSKTTFSLYNSFVGAYAGLNHADGLGNSFFGYASGGANTSGSSNTFSGMFSGRKNTIGGFNVFIGTSSGNQNNTGSNNTAIGSNSGYNLRSGSYNIILGADAGPTDTIDMSNRLFIDVEQSDTPLIYGEFDNDLIRINGIFETTGGVAPSSSRSIKSQFVSVDASTILAKVAAMDIQQWVYNDYPDQQHIGPVAEDFYDAFGLGRDNKHINTTDADGVALLAIKALKKENDELKEQLKILAERVAQLEIK